MSATPTFWRLRIGLITISEDRWWVRGACHGVGPKPFFPPVSTWKTDPRDNKGLDNLKYYAMARSICAGCPVQPQCLEDVVTLRDFHGFRAGYTPRQLHRLARGLPVLPYRNQGRPKRVIEEESA